MPLTDSRSGNRGQESPEDRLARLLQPLQSTQNLAERRRELIDLMESGSWDRGYFSRREMNQAHEQLDLCNRMLQIGEAQDIMARPRVFVPYQPEWTREYLGSPQELVPRSPDAPLLWEVSPEPHWWVYNEAQNIRSVAPTTSGSTLSPSRSSNPGDSAITSGTLSNTLPGQDTSTHPRPQRTSRRRGGTSTGPLPPSVANLNDLNDIYRSVYQPLRQRTRYDYGIFNVDEPAYTIPARDLWAETSKVWYNISLEHAKKVGVTIES